MTEIMLMDEVVGQPVNLYCQLLVVQEVPQQLLILALRYAETGSLLVLKPVTIITP